MGPRSETINFTSLQILELLMLLRPFMAFLFFQVRALLTRCHQAEDHLTENVPRRLIGSREPEAKLLL